MFWCISQLMFWQHSIVSGMSDLPCKMCIEFASAHNLFCFLLMKYCWWFRNPKANHLGWWKPYNHGIIIILGGAGLLSHQQYVSRVFCCLLWGWKIWRNTWHSASHQANILNFESENGGLVQIIFLLHWLIFVSVPAVHFPGDIFLSKKHVPWMRLHQGFLNFA